METPKLNITQVPVTDLRPSGYTNPRRWSEEAIAQLTESLQRFGFAEPILANSAPGRENVIIGGYFRLKVAKDLGYTTVPVIYLNIPDIEKEKELNIRLNKNLGDWDFKLLAEFDTSLLEDVGFNSIEMDEILGIDDTPEIFDLAKELEKLNIKEIEIQKGDIWQLGEHRLCCGDSTLEPDILKLMNGEKADMCLTDPPYKISYLLGGKRHGKPVTRSSVLRLLKLRRTDVVAVGRGRGDRTPDFGFGDQRDTTSPCPFNQLLVSSVRVSSNLIN